MSRNEITIGEVSEIAELHEIDADLFPLFSIAAFRCTQLIPGTCARIYNAKQTGCDLIAVKNYDESMIVLFTQPGHVENPGMYARPIPDTSVPEIIPGINLSKYLFTNVQAHTI